jgi:simple sugar transport system permease protein
MRIALLIACAVGLVYGAIVLAGAAPVEVFKSLIQGTLGSPRAIEGTLKEVTPLLIAGVAVYYALKAGLFNIGVEGQFMVGALGCAVIALRFPGTLGLILGVLVGALLGGLWALPAGLIKALKGGHEVITTIMLNNIAVQLTTALAAGRFKDPAQQGSTTASLPRDMMLPAIGSAPKVNLAIFVGIVLVVLIWLWFSRTVSGYEIQAVGANARAASLAGVDAKRVTIRAMVISGAIGGVAGALQVVAFEGRFFAGFSGGYGFDALGVALLAGAHPFLLLPSALLFGVLNRGSTILQVAHNVPKGLSTVILGLLIIVFAAVRYRKAIGRES